MIKTLATAATAALALAAISAQAAKADAIPYPCCGYNDTTYDFTAASTGDVVAYFAGSTAGYENEMGLLDNGTLTSAGYGLDNKTSTLGQAFDLGHVTAGDTLVFVLHNLSLGANAYSDPSMNVAYDDGPATGTTDGHNHVYETPYTATDPILDDIPTGSFVAFEDLRFPDSDYNYNDETFVFTNVMASVPEPATWAVMLLGFGAVGAVMRTRRQRPAATA